MMTYKKLRIYFTALLPVLFVATTLTVTISNTSTAAVKNGTKSCVVKLRHQPPLSRRAYFERSIKAIELNAISAKHIITLVNGRLPQNMRALMITSELDDLLSTIFADYNSEFDTELYSFVMKEDAELAMKYAEENLDSLLREKGFSIDSQLSPPFFAALSESAEELYQVYRESSMMNARMAHTLLH